MDIQHLVDRLEQVLAESRRIPMLNVLLVNEDQIFNIVDQMRVTIPEEVKRANRVEAEKERILAQAQEEAERIRELAKQEASELVRRDTVTASAQQRAENIVERARHDAAQLRQEADMYVMDELSRLEEDLLRSLSVVRNGMRKLQADHQMAEQEQSPAGAPSPQPTGEK